MTIGEGAVVCAPLYLLAEPHIPLPAGFTEGDQLRVCQITDDSIAAFLQMPHGNGAAGGVVRADAGQVGVDERLVDEHRRTSGGKQTVDMGAFHQVLRHIGDDSYADGGLRLADDPQEIIAVILAVVEHRIIAPLAQTALNPF